MPNFHGSTGFGRYADSILGNHGEKPAADMLAALAWLRARDDVAPRRIAVAGGSLGVRPGRAVRLRRPLGPAFELRQRPLDRPGGARPLVAFAGGAAVRDPNPGAAREKDYRVPVTQGINLDGVLTGKGVPARIVIFPDENHWILKPQASRLWHREFFAWLERFPERRD